MLDVSQDEKNNRNRSTKRATKGTKPTEKNRTYTKSTQKEVPKLCRQTLLGVQDIRRTKSSANQFDNNSQTNESKTHNEANAAVEKVEYVVLYSFLLKLKISDERRTNRSGE